MHLQTIKSILVVFLVTSLFISCDNGSGRRRSDIGESSSPVVGRVVKIVDGDTYDILFPDNHLIRVRMEGIDAPEKGMPFYNISKSYLGELCFEKNIRLEIESKDRYGRTLAKSFLNDGRELGAEMIKAGMAWHFKKYSSDQQLSSWEVEARNKKLGLWADENPNPPWKVRKNKKAGKLEVTRSEAP